MTLTNLTLHAADELEQQIDALETLEAAWIELIERTLDDQLQAIEQE